MDIVNFNFPNHKGEIYVNIYIFKVNFEISYVFCPISVIANIKANAAP